jgi:hypothetical protein
MPDAVDCAADARLLSSLFGRYGPQPPWRIVREDPAVRFYLPSVTQSAGQAGLYSYFSFAGDFEVSAGFEVLNIQPPKDGYGATCGICVEGQGTAGSVSLSRGETPGKKGGYVVSRGQPDGGQTKYDTNYFPSSAKVGRLMLRRENDEVICLTADLPTGELQELCRVPFSPASIRQVRFFADNGGSHTAVDVRLSQLQVRAREIAGGVPKYEPPRSWGWWWWAGGGCAIAAGAVVLALRFRTGHWLWSGGAE